MSKNLEKIMKAELKAKQVINAANKKAEDIINESLSTTIETISNLHIQTENTIKKSQAEKKEKIAAIDAELKAIMQNEKDQMVDVVSKNISGIIASLYEEVVGND